MHEGQSVHIVSTLQVSALSRKVLQGPTRWSARTCEDGSDQSYHSLLPDNSTELDRILRVDNKIVESVVC